MIPLRYMGDGEFRAMHPGRCDRDLVIGEVKNWQIVDDERSMRSHNHYFALIAEAWSNLPERLADDLPNPEALRKYALIKSGYCTVDKVVCASNREAVRLAAFLGGGEEYRIVEVSERLVTIWTARSQKMKRSGNGGMGKTEFQESKDAVLHVISELLGTDVTTLRSAA